MESNAANAVVTTIARASAAWVVRAAIAEQVGTHAMLGRRRRCRHRSAGEVGWDPAVAAALAADRRPSSNSSAAATSTGLERARLPRWLTMRLHRGWTTARVTSMRERRTLRIACAMRARWGLLSIRSATALTTHLRLSGNASIAIATLRRWIATEDTRRWACRLHRWAPCLRLREAIPRAGVRALLLRAAMSLLLRLCDDALARAPVRSRRVEDADARPMAEVVPWRATRLTRR